ncbi:hypothetical protein FDI69_gp137 [Rhodococcus phage Trina]|uniref:Uncharacterized protein n=1 Tax=Rhodococcus phage Trina TaxID=2027905 RepID=A0A2D0ZNS3_9CAUD|nr:hypothetical protein FDI69_gp137 [Rhodococcus phage Trina]ASZ75048.1 hypothetical protein SEA_TRINA_270 [Rhodococcus phage Trina]
MFKSVADMKRQLVPGTVIRMVRHDWYPSGPLIGEDREIVSANSVGIKIKTERNGETVESGMDWPRPKYISFTENGWKVQLDPQTDKFMEYVVVR